MRGPDPQPTLLLPQFPENDTTTADSTTLSSPQIGSPTSCRRSSYEIPLLDGIASLPPRVHKMGVQEPIEGTKPPFLKAVSAGKYGGNSGILCCAQHTDLDANTRTVTTRTGCIIQSEDVVQFEDVRVVSRDSCGGMAFIMRKRESPMTILAPRYCCCVISKADQVRGEPGLEWVFSLLRLNGARRAEYEYHAPMLLAEANNDDNCTCESCMMT